MQAQDANQAYQRFVEDRLDKEYDSPLQATTASSILGRSDFVSKVVAKHLGAKPAERNIPATRELAPRPTLDAIIMKVRTELGEEAESLRTVTLYCCQHYSGAKLKEIGERFGISDAAVSQASRRLALKAETDQQLRRMLSRLRNLLGNGNATDDVACSLAISSQPEHRQPTALRPRT